MSSIPLAINNAPPPTGALSLQALINQTRLQQQAEQQNTQSLQQQQQLAPLQVQQQQAQTQESQIQAQQAQQQQQDIQRFNKAFLDSGGDWNQTIANAPAAGVSAMFMQQAQMNRMKLLQTMQGYSEGQAKILNDQSDAMGKAALVVKDAAPEDRATIAAQQLNTLKTSGLFQPGQLPETVPTDDKSLDTYIAHSAATQDLIKEAQANKASQLAQPGIQAAETAKQLQSVAQQLANTPGEASYQAVKMNAKSQGIPDSVLSQFADHWSPEAVQQAARMSLTPEQQQGMSQAVADSRYRNILMKQSQGQPVSADDKAFLSAYQRQKLLVPTARINLQMGTGGLGVPGTGGGGAGGGTTGGAGGGTPQQQYSVNDVPPAIRGTVQAIVNYQDKLPPSGRQNPRNNAIQQWVYQLDPTHDETTYPARNKIVQNFTSGSGSTQINALNTVTSHVAVLKQAIASLNNGDITGLNKIGNYLGVNVTGQTAPAAFQTIVNRVGPEIAAAYIQGGGGEGERGTTAADFSVNLPPQTLNSNADVTLKLLGGKVDALRQQWQNTYKPSRPEDQFDNKFLLPAAKAAWGAATGSAGGGGPQQTTGHKVGDLITQNGHNFKVNKVDANGVVKGADPQ